MACCLTATPPASAGPPPETPAATASATLPASRPAPGCGDFLAERRLKPAHLDFTGCTAGHLHQVPALVATYRVAGRHAAAVEAHLRRHTGMAPLRFICCGWEPDPRARHRLGRLPGPAGLDHEVAMGSGETLLRHRTAWTQIPAFEVTVTLPLEAP